MKPRHPAPLNALRAFEAAARCLSFNDAARQLFVTPAAVSHQVKHLESYLGTSLFIRGNRSVQLTAQGRALAATLGELFARLDLALDEATAHATTDLRVSTMESFAAKWLAPRLHRFHRSFPDVRLHVDTGNELADVARGTVDIAIRYGRGDYPGVLVERLMEAPVIAVCAPSLVAGETLPLSNTEALRNHTLLHDESATGRTGVPAWADWLQAMGARDIDAHRGPVFASIYLAQEAAIAGHGVALGVAPLVKEDLRDGRLVALFDQPMDNAHAFWLVRRQDTVPNPAIEALCTWLREEAAEDAAFWAVQVSGG